MLSEVYEVGRKSFEDMTEMLLNNKNISNDQRRGLREAYVLSKREEYCLIGKSDDEVEAPEVDERYSEGAPVPLYSQTVWWYRYIYDVMPWYRRQYDVMPW